MRFDRTDCIHRMRHCLGGGGGGVGVGVGGGGGGGGGSRKNTKNHFSRN